MTDRDAPDDGRSPADLAAAIAGGEPVRLLDVRNRDAFEAWHVTGPTVTATQVPHVQWLQARVTDSVADVAETIAGEGPITVVCGRGEASAAVADQLRDAGYDAHNLAGGMRAWGRVLRRGSLPTDGPVTVWQYQRPATGCLSYTVLADGNAAVVDPLDAFAERYAGDVAAADATLEYVIDTHVHADHLSGVRSLAEATGATPVMPRLATERGVTFEVESVVDGSELAVGTATLEAMHLPGHTTGMTGFRCGNVLLAGDSLFLTGVARPDLQQGDSGVTPLATQLYQSLTERLAELPDDTLVAPGHYAPEGPATTDGTYTASLGTLRDRLSVFGMDRSTFVARLVRNESPPPSNFERIIAANTGREPLPAEEARDLELGPNNCAANP